MILFGRKVILTTLDPVPRAFRTAPGYIALNTAEFKSLNNELAAPSRSPGPQFREILAIVVAEDNLEAEKLERRQPPERRK